MRRVLFLDDEEVRHEVFEAKRGDAEVVHVYSYRQAVTVLAGPRFDEAHLDHDLGPDECVTGKSGAHVAQHIASMAPESRPRAVIIHSMNPIGARRMYDILTDAGVAAVLKPFGY